MNHFIKINADMIINVSHVVAIDRLPDEEKTPVLHFIDGDNTTVTEKVYEYFESIAQDMTEGQS